MTGTVYTVNYVVYCRYFYRIRMAAALTDDEIDLELAFEWEDVARELAAALARDMSCAEAVVCFEETASTRRRKEDSHFAAANEYRPFNWEAPHMAGQLLRDVEASDRTTADRAEKLRQFAAAQERVTREEQDDDPVKDVLISPRLR